jgi:MYXO-CTERM domain-containing protein
MRNAVSIVAVVITSPALASSILTADFEDPGVAQLPNTLTAVASVNSDGVNIISGGGLYVGKASDVLGDYLYPLADNGTTTMYSNLAGTTHTVSLLSGNRFSLLTADFAEGYSSESRPDLLPNKAEAVRVAGFRNDVQVAIITLELDGLINQAGVSDFQQFSFNSSFSELDYFTVQGVNEDTNRGSTYFSFDNLRLDTATIPSPTAAFAGLIGLAGMTTRRRRREK